jgi:hypothetical protein
MFHLWNRSLPCTMGFLGGKLTAFNLRASGRNIITNRAGTRPVSTTDVAGALDVRGRGIQARSAKPAKKLGSVDERAQMLLQAVEHYKTVYNLEDGSILRIPGSFVVPRDSSTWPQKFWSLKLGDKLEGVVRFGNFPSYHNEFQRLGVPVDSKAEKILEALETYKLVYGVSEGAVLVIPHDFVVPHGDPAWPPPLWGMGLGFITSDIMSKNSHRKYRARFEQLGLRFDRPTAAEDSVSHTIHAVETYKKVNNIAEGATVHIPATFVVPHGHSVWPQDLWGMRLGRVTASILTGDKFSKHQDEFIKLGLIRKLGDPDDRARRLVLAVKTYKKVHNLSENDAVAIPQVFVVPRDSSDWPQALWGMKLGAAVAQLLCKNLFSNYRDEFARLGLTARYGSYDAMAQRLFTAIKTYKKVYDIPHDRSVFIPEKFVVPRDSPDWPQELWGMKLGRTVAGVRHRGNYKDYHYELTCLGVTVGLGKTAE